MTTASSNNNDITATLNIKNNSNDNYNKMNTSRSIKISFQGASREVDLPTPATLSALQAAVASTFKVELAPRSEAAGGADTDLSFTYRDSDGDDIVFDKDSEFSLALRLCPSPLEICAASKQKDKKDADKPEEEKRIYRRAARNLREYNGVPSMTPPKLVLTLAFLKLHPRSLVKQGLAPAQLLAEVKAPEPLSSDSNDDLAEAVRSDMELMSVENDKKEWNDGFVSVDKKPMTDVDTDAKAIRNDHFAAEAGTCAGNSSSSEEEGCSGSDGGGKKKGASKAITIMHGAFLSAGIKLRPREVMPLLLALGVRPRRLVKLGRVDGTELKKAMLESGKHGRRNLSFGGRGGGCGMGPPNMGNPRARGGRPGGPGCMRGGPPGRRVNGSRGPGAKLCGPGGKPCMPGRHSGGGSPMFFPPPPPPHGDAICGGGGPSGFCAPHHQHGHLGGGGGGGAGGCPVSPEMVMRMEARAARHAAARQGGRGGRRGVCGARGGAGGGGNERHWYGYWG